MSACCEGIAVIVVGDSLREGCALGLRGCVICPAFVLLLRRHQTVLPREFDSTAIIWQVKGRLDVIVEEAPIPLTIMKSRYASDAAKPSASRSTGTPRGR